MSGKTVLYMCVDQYPKTTGHRIEKHFISMSWPRKYLLLLANGVFILLFILCIWTFTFTDKVNMWPQNEDKMHILAYGHHSASILKDSRHAAYTMDTKHAKRPIQDGGQEPWIPHIFHQHWDTYNVPRRFRKWIKSWVVKHPKWEYWFWTPKEVRQLLYRYYPQYLQIYDNYPKMLNRADVMRYFVLYKYGGIYLDLDMECVKPIDSWTYQLPCFGSEETYEHTYFQYKTNQPGLMNGILGCRPNHPFYNLTIHWLSEYASIKHVKGGRYSTGPLFINDVYLRYNASSNNQRDLPQKDLFTALHPDYFLPTHDPAYSYKRECGKKNLTIQQTELCTTKKMVNFRNEIKSCSYADHHWFHVVMYSKKWKATNTINIILIVSHARIPDITS